MKSNDLKETYQQDLILDEEITCPIFFTSSSTVDQVKHLLSFFSVVFTKTSLPNFFTTLIMAILAASLIVLFASFLKNRKYF